MDAVKFIKEYHRLCKSQDDCYRDCPLSGVGCMHEEEFYDVEKAVEIVEKWSAEHPQKTILMDFLEKYPNAPIDEDDKTPTVCPYSLGYEEEDAHG